MGVYDPITNYVDSLGDKISKYSILERAQYIESTLFMSGYLLSSQGDRVGMANSVEGRYPFLDYRLIEFCASLPDEFKMRGLNEKYLLKRMMNGRLPEAVLKRPKQAYRAPVSQAIIRENPDLVAEYLSANSINSSGVFDWQNVNKLLAKVQGGKGISEVDNMAFIALLSTQILIKQFIDDFKPLDLAQCKRGVIRNKKI